MQTRAPTRAQERIKEQVIAALIWVRADLLTAATSIPEDHCTDIFLGAWSLLDLLAHLAGWDEANRAAVKELMAGCLPSFYAFHDPDWRTYNARLVQKYRRANLEEQIALARASHLHLVEALRAAPADAFNRDFGVRVRGYKVTIRRLMEAETKDEAVHLAQVRKFAPLCGRECPS